MLKTLDVPEVCQGYNRSVFVDEVMVEGWWCFSGSGG